MHATRILRSRGGSHFLPGNPKLLLPPVTFWEHASASLQGAWSHVVDQQARDAYEEAIQNHVIKDTVLQNATGGAAITFSLFHNLQNPLFQKYKFDAKEFVTTVGPALENFHDTLACLRNQLPENLGQEKEELNEKLQKSDEELLSANMNNNNNQQADNLAVSLLGVNHWREQAEKDSDTLAARLSKMTTDVCLDAFYYTSKLDILSRATLDSANTTSGLNDYIPGSCKVNEVALLSARAMVIDDNNDDDGKKQEIDVEHPEFEASEEGFDKDGNVAAQIDVLYEITHTYKANDPVEGAYAVMMNDDSNDTDNNKSSSPKTDTAEEKTEDEETVAKKEDQNEEESSSEDVGGDTIMYTNLAVAVFEGWLHREANGNNGLRWKVALLREAFEFPQNQPTIIRNPSS